MTMTMTMIKVLIVDDIKLLRECLKLAIDSHSGFKVVGCAGDGIEAYDMCTQLRPDVVLMDILMPVCDGIETTLKIKTNFPEIKVLILTAAAEEENIGNAINNGADGYVLKDIGTEELLLAIRSVYTGLNLIHHHQNSENESNGNENIKTDSIDTNERINDLIIVKDSDGEISAKIRSRAIEIVNEALKNQKNIDKGMLITQEEIDKAME